LVNRGRLQFLATMGCVAGAAALFADSAAGRKVVANSRGETTAASQRRRARGGAGEVLGKRRRMGEANRNGMVA
jgi:hypothetical protein